MDENNGGYEVAAADSIEEPMKLIPRIPHQLK